MIFFSEQVTLAPFLHPGSFSPVVVTGVAPADTSALSNPTHPLGSLSMVYETGFRPGQEALAAGRVSSGINDPGGVSYGAYQMASRKGVVQDFLRHDGRSWADQLAGLDPKVRGGAFGAGWKGIAATDGSVFFDAQHSYIEKTHYDRVVTKVLNRTGLDINAQSDAVQNAGKTAEKRSQSRFDSARGGR